MLPYECAVAREMQGKYTCFLGILLLNVSSILVLENVKWEISVALLGYGPTHVLYVMDIFVYSIQFAFCS